MKVEVIQAWSHRFERIALELDDGASVGDALAASGFDTGEAAGVAVFGANVDAGAKLHDGDRVELLRPLLADPKEARRKRAEGFVRRKPA